MHNIKNNEPKMVTIIIIIILEFELLLGNGCGFVVDDVKLLGGLLVVVFKDSVEFDVVPDTNEVELDDVVEVVEVEEFKEIVEAVEVLVVEVGLKTLKNFFK
jgi:hypothetical protein